MARLPFLSLVAALVAAAALPAVADAADPLPPTPPATAEEVPAAFARAVNARSAAARPCSLLAREARMGIALWELMRVEPLVGEQLWPEQATDACDRHVARETGFGSGVFGDRGGWLRVEVGSVRTVATRGDVVQLRARVRQVAAPDYAMYASDTVESLYVVREEGEWRLGEEGTLLPNGIAARSLAAFVRERDDEAAANRRGLRQRARWAREAAAARRPVSTAPLGCGTGRRAATSGLRDRRSGGLTGPNAARDPRAVAADVVEARLSVGRARTCWTVRLRRPATAPLRVAFMMVQETPSWRDEDPYGGWVLLLRDGHAYGATDDRPIPNVRVFPVRVSVRGSVVRAVVPAARARGQVDLRRPFGWGLFSYTPVPGHPVPGTEWIDSLPRLVTWDDLAGIDHPPVRRGR